MCHNKSVTIHRPTHINLAPLGKWNSFSQPQQYLTYLQFITYPLRSLSETTIKSLKYPSASSKIPHYFIGNQNFLVFFSFFKRGSKEDLNCRLKNTDFTSVMCS